MPGSELSHSGTIYSGNFKTDTVIVSLMMRQYPEMRVTQVTRDSRGMRKAWQAKLRSMLSVTSAVQNFGETKKPRMTRMTRTKKGRGRESLIRVIREIRG